MRKDKALLKFLSNPAVIRRHYSPTIPRSFPAQRSVPISPWVEWGIVGVVSCILLLLILMLSLQINRQIAELAKRQSAHDSVIAEIDYWKAITTQYPDYRDGYFRLALLEYQVGNESLAVQAVDTAIVLDPHFQAGIAFKEKLRNE